MKDKVVSATREKEKKELVTSSSWQPVQQGNIATFIVAPLLVIIWPFFLFFSSQPDCLVLTCHSAHKESMWVEKTFLFIAALLATPHIQCACVCVPSLHPFCHPLCCSLSHSSVREGAAIFVATGCEDTSQGILSPLKCSWGHLQVCWFHFLRCPFWLWVSILP